MSTFQKFATRLGVIQPRAAEPAGAPRIPSRAEIIQLSPELALTLGSVYRAVSIIAIAAKQLPIKAYRGGTEIMRPTWLTSPNLDDDTGDIIEQLVTSMALTGNAYLHVTEALGNVLEIKPLPAGNVVINHNGDHLRPRITYGYGESVFKPYQRGAGNGIIHLKLLRVPGYRYGLGAIQTARAEFTGAIKTRDYAANWFQTSGVPAGVLKTDQPLTPKQADDYLEIWNSQDAGQTRVLGSGLGYETFYLKPADLQFLESRKFDTTEIARIFGLTPSLMLAAVDGTSMSYSNIEQDWLQFTRFGLMGYLTEIETKLARLLPHGQQLKFNVDALLRSDTKTRYEAHAIGIDKGFLTTDEARALENRPILKEHAEQ